MEHDDLLVGFACCYGWSLQTFVHLFLAEHGLLLDALPDWVGGLERVLSTGLHLVCLLSERLIDGLKHATCFFYVFTHLFCQLNMLRAHLAKLLSILIG